MGDKKREFDHAVELRLTLGPAVGDKLSKQRKKTMRTLRAVVFRAARNALAFIDKDSPPLPEGSEIRITQLEDYGVAALRERQTPDTSNLITIDDVVSAIERRGPNAHIAILRQTGHSPRDPPAGPTPIDSCLAVDAAIVLLKNYAERVRQLEAWQDDVTVIVADVRYNFDIPRAMLRLKALTAEMWDERLERAERTYRRNKEQGG